ncbi:MAG: aldose 1-epimerase [Pseudomonadota bacterium]
MDAVLGDWSMSVRPDLGGSLTRLFFKDDPVLRPSDGRSITSPLEGSGFVLAPYSGRIRNAAFVNRGRRIELKRNFSPEPHSIHGVSWTSDWQIKSNDPSGVRLVHEYRGNEWPWPFDVEQTFRANGNTLSVELQFTNRADKPAPAGLGWHPYFPDPGGATLTANAISIWRRDKEGIAVEPRVPEKHEDIRNRKRVMDLSLDDCFSLDQGPVEIVWPDRKTAITLKRSASLGHLIVYTPADQPFFCVEPVSHVPDAFNSSLPFEQTGMRTLHPNDVLTARIDLVAGQA